MKSNSKITIWIFAIILIFWISFLFIEQGSKSNITTNKTNNTSVENNKNQHNTQAISEQAKELKQQQIAEQKKIKNIKEEKALKERLEDEAQKIAEQKYQETMNNKPYNSKNTKTTQPIIIPKEYDIQNMEFFSQAPYGNWNQPYQDACEEASLLIWYYYIKWLNKSKTEYNKDLLDMVDLERKTLWYFESTTITEMKQIINIRDPTIKAKIIEHPTIRDIEKEISQNNAVIAPFYGKWINNPHYSLEGPEYHFMVIKWYDQTNFITHDVWTSKWKNREYTKSTIMDNIHDRNRIDVQKWAARILILSK